jgi:hypothetical protein
MERSLGIVIGCMESLLWNDVRTLVDIVHVSKITSTILNMSCKFESRSVSKYNRCDNAWKHLVCLLNLSLI